jgi:hypothetical protein
LRTSWNLFKLALLALASLYEKFFRIKDSQTEFFNIFKMTFIIASQLPATATSKTRSSDGSDKKGRQRKNISSCSPI